MRDGVLFFIGGKMGYREAVEDQIKIRRLSPHEEMYLLPCAVCGAEVTSLSYNRTFLYLCLEHKKLRYQLKKQMKIGRL